MARKHPTISIIRKWASDAACEWMAEHSSKEVVKQSVYATFNGKLSQLVLELMGLERSFGNWQVRSGDKSPFTGVIQKQVENCVQEFVDELFRTRPVLSEKQLAAIRKAYTDAYIYRAQSIASDLGDTRATEEVEKLLEKVWDEDGDSDVPADHQDSNEADSDQPT